MGEKHAFGYGLSLIIGVLLGAALGLLFAPSSGDELRRNIKEQVDSQYAKLQEEIQKNMEKMQSAMDKVSLEITKATDRNEEAAATE